MYLSDHRLRIRSVSQIQRGSTTTPANAPSPPLTTLAGSWILPASSRILAQENPSQKYAMPTRHPPCPRCQDNLFVRAEQVISGRRVTQAFFCGRCTSEWTVEDPLQQAEERRQGERRKRKVVIKRKRE
jgi:hypothetical protein